MIKCIDLGNYYVKTDEMICFSSAFKKVDKDSIPISKDIITINNESFQIGIGSYDKNYNKATKEYLPNLLFALKGITSVDLVLGVPIENIGIGDKIRTDLLEKTFNYDVDGKKYTTYINKVAVIGEGISTYYLLDKDIKNTDLVIIDIGGRTVNVAAYKNGKLFEKMTIPKGSIDLFKDIITAWNVNNGTNYTTEIAEEYITKNLIKVPEGSYQAFIKFILNEISFKIDLKAYRQVFTGGGSLLLKNQIESLEGKITVLDNALFSNVLGNKKIAEVKWR